MEPTIIISVVALVIIVAIVIAWIISSNKAKTAYLLDLSEQANAFKVEIVRKESEAIKAEQLLKKRGMRRCWRKLRAVMRSL